MNTISQIVGLNQPSVYIETKHKGGGETVTRLGLHVICQREFRRNLLTLCADCPLWNQGDGGCSGFIDNHSDNTAGAILNPAQFLEDVKQGKQPRCMSAQAAVDTATIEHTRERDF
jgi:hypothetical protein